MKNRWKNLQPWLDYFEMLQSYEKNGYLEISKDKNEAFITAAAMCTLAETGDTPLQHLQAYADVTRRIHAYIAWRKRRGHDYLREPFALTVVKDDKSHDMLATILVSYRRRWWRPWKKEEIQVINYEL